MKPLFILIIFGIYMALGSLVFGIIDNRDGDLWNEYKKVKGSWMEVAFWLLWPATMYKFLRRKL